MGSNIPGNQPLSIDTGLSNTRSMPTTPATTPPGNNMQSMQPYQGQPSYDNSKSYYSAAPSSQAPYAPQHPMSQQQQPDMARYGQPISTNPYMKNEMGPPTGRSSGSEPHPADNKADQYAHSQGNVQVGHGPGEGEAENEHGTEYINDNSAYNANRGSYTYTANPPVGTIAGEHSHLSPEITGSPHHNNSGRGTPRTAAGNQTQWASGYHTPPRAPPSSNVFHVMSDTRGSGTNGTVDAYSTSSAAPPAYPAPSMNGNSGSNKRGRDDDENDQAPRADAHENDVAGYEHKRRKTLSDASIGGPVRGAPLGVQGMTPGIVSRRR